MMKTYYFTSESVTEGHPDKLCDLISDCILDEYLKQDENARVAVETFASGNTITIAGQVTAKGEIDIEPLVRNTIKEIGFDNAQTDMDYRTCKIDINITKQSPDIALGVDIRWSRRPRDYVWLCNRRNTKLYAICNRTIASVSKKANRSKKKQRNSVFKTRWKSTSNNRIRRGYSKENRYDFNFNTT